MRAQALHLCATQETFDALGAHFITVLRAAGETSFADWFQEQYLSAPWNVWYITASGLPGLIPSNNHVRPVLSLIIREFYMLVMYPFTDVARPRSRRRQ